MINIIVDIYSLHKKIIVIKTYVAEYLMLYPDGKKIVPYMNALKENYADYVMPDGLVEKTTFYAESNYVNIQFVKEIYKHRIDKLLCVEITHATENIETIEYFSNGRKDCMKGAPKRIQFNSRNVR